MLVERRVNLVLNSLVAIYTPPALMFLEMVLQDLDIIVYFGLVMATCTNVSVLISSPIRNGFCLWISS